MSGDEWELTPHHKVEELRTEIEKLKKNPFSGSGSGENVMEAVKKLDHSIQELIQIFKMAQEDMADPEKEKSRFQELNDKIDNLTEENKKIARAVLSVVSLIRGEHKKKPQQQPPTGPKPMAPPGQQGAPFIKKDTNMPPPPPQNPDREAAFDKFKQ